MNGSAKNRSPKERLRFGWMVCHDRFQKKRTESGKTLKGVSVRH